MQNKKRQFYNVDFLKTILCIIVVYFHIFSNIKKAITGVELEQYNFLANSKNAFLAVEFFFIISGFFLPSYKENLASVGAFIYKKIARLWPTLAFSFFCIFIFSLCGVGKADPKTLFVDLFFLQCIGVTHFYKGITWYVSSYFWTIIFYYYLIKNFKPKYTNIIIALCVYFSLVGITNSFGAGSREVFANFFCAGILRALAGIGIGYFVKQFFEKIKNFCKDNFSSKLSLTIFTLIEFSSFAFLIYNFIFFNSRYKDKIIYTIVFIILFISFLLKKGILSKILDNNFFAFSGKYSYAIYVMQQTSFLFLSVTLWKIKYIINHPELCIFLTLVIALLIGIITYYFIEKPLAKKFLKIVKEYKETKENI